MVAGVTFDGFDSGPARPGARGKSYRRLPKITAGDWKSNFGHQKPGKTKRKADNRQDAKDAKS